MDDRRRNIVLVGFMGTGKTSVGKGLAQRLGLRFVDMDSVIEERQGKPIPRIFAEDGEPRFRALERELVRELAAGSGQVIATGGGVVLNPENVSDYARSGLVVCLSAEPDTIFQRVAADSSRPLLAGDKKQKILEILAARRSRYAAIPCRIDTTALSVSQAIEKVATLYGERE
jgi:shikimate kinase